MKKIFLKPGLQLAVILSAVFGAFAFSKAPAKSTAYTNVEGRLPVNCAESGVQCTTDGGPFCQSGTTTLFEWDGSACGQPLHKIPN